MGVAVKLVGFNQSENKFLRYAKTSVREPGLFRGSHSRTGSPTLIKTLLDEIRTHGINILILNIKWFY
jgi:hypothetical protein